MKNVFGKIINFLSVSFCILMPTGSVMANYVDADGVDVVEIVATPWVDSQQTTAPIQSSGPTQGIDARAYAERAAAEEQGRKIGECYKQKALVPISQGQCKAQASTFMTSWSVQNCQESGGLFWPNFGFDSTYFTFVSEYPKTQYSTYAQCEKLTAAAINQFQADCTSKGDLAVYKTCEAAGVK